MPQLSAPSPRAPCNTAWFCPLGLSPRHTPGSGDTGATPAPSPPAGGIWVEVGRGGSRQDSGTLTANDPRVKNIPTGNCQLITFRISFTRSAAWPLRACSCTYNLPLSWFPVLSGAWVRHQPIGTERALTDASRASKAGARLHLQDLSGALVLTWPLGLPTPQGRVQFLMQGGQADGLKSPKV